MRWVMISFSFLAIVLNYVHRLSFNYLSAAGDLRKLIVCTPEDALNCFKQSDIDGAGNRKYAGF